MNGNLSECVLITGANRGIGLGLVSEFLNRGYQVIATCRTPDKANELQNLKLEYPQQLRIEKLDVTNSDDFANLLGKISDEKIDILINNAGIFPENHSREGIERSLPEQVMSAFNINTLGAFRAIQAFLPNLQQSPNPRIINLSSLMGSLHHAKGFGYSYRMSKVALNMLTRSFAAENHEIITIALRPGWVKTAMGGIGANIPVEESASKMVGLIETLKPSDSGSFIDYDKEPTAW